MKLYATVQSERATKGQGGKYLDIVINNENKENIFRVYVEDREDEIYAEFVEYSTGAKHIFSNEKTKGEKQKGENPLCKKCGLTWPKGTREATRDFVYSDVCIKHQV